jgi:hypothetical protein
MARNILALKEMVLFPLMYPEIFGMRRDVAARQPWSLFNWSSIL